MGRVEVLKKNLSQVLWFVGVLGLYLLIGLFLFGLLEGYIDPSAIKDPSKEATARKDLLQALGFLMVGVAGAIGIYFTWRGQRLTQESLEDNRKNTTEEQELTRQGQITERFTRAIDQLGATDDKQNPRLEIRLGGIYALERIDKESPERAYHRTVMEVLTAYVRENYRWKHEEPSTPTKASNKGVEQDIGDAQATRPTLGEGRFPPDIRAILDVLKRREEESVPEKYRIQYLDLRGTDLRGANLRGADLRRANLWGANLQDANFQDANLEGADLEDAYLQGARELTPDQIEWTIGSNKTQLPPDLNRPERWDKPFEEQVKIVSEHISGG